MGTPLFAPLNAHEGGLPSERDDLESAIYSLVHLYYGRLPWTPKSGDPPSAQEPPKGVDGPWFPDIAAQKGLVDASLLVGGDWLPSDHAKANRPLPSCFATAFRYVQCLAIFQEPTVSGTSLSTSKRRPVPNRGVDHSFLIHLFVNELERLEKGAGRSPSRFRAWEWHNHDLQNRPVGRT